MSGFGGFNFIVKLILISVNQKGASMEVLVLKDWLQQLAVTVLLNSQEIPAQIATNSVLA